MILSNYNSLCKDSENYYYDFLCSDRRGLVPESIIDHIKQCVHCQRKIERLELMLSQADAKEPEQSQADNTTATMLQLHFSYIDKQVTCEAVRSFLPTLLEPALEIRIPTPITAHLDNCQLCSEDLGTIRSLNLTRSQLHRLSQLFADKDTGLDTNCAQAHNTILKILAINLRETNAEDLKHISLCSYCRKLLYQYRESWRNELLNKKIDTRFPCNEVSASDIFDYVVPYGLDPDKDQYAKFRESLATHLRNCPTCLLEMQQLHNIVYRIVQRHESGVVTTYNIDESAKMKPAGESNDLYAGFPIKVEVINQRDRARTKLPVSTTDFDTSIKKKISAKRLKPLLKPALAAAAVILIASALLLNTSKVEAVTLEKIYKAIKQIDNVHVAFFVPKQKEPIQEKWVSLPLNTYITKSGNQWILWDVANKQRKIKDIDTGTTRAVQLTEDDLAGIKKKMSVYLDLMPFYDMTDIPYNAKWIRVDDANLHASTKNLEVYDLQWIVKNNTNLTTFNKWRVFVHAKTNLPQRTELYQRLADETEYTLYSVKIIDYIVDSEMQQIIKEISF